MGHCVHDQKLDPDAIFGRTAPKILEIGFGMGDTTATIAQPIPKTTISASKSTLLGVGSLLNYTEDMGLTNLRIIQHDAVEVLKHMMTAEVWMAFISSSPTPGTKNTTISGA